MMDRNRRSIESFVVSFVVVCLLLGARVSATAAGKLPSSVCSVCAALLGVARPVASLSCSLLRSRVSGSSIIMSRQKYTPALVEQIRNNTFPHTTLDLYVRSDLQLSLSLSLSLLWLISCWFDGQEALLLCHELDKIEMLTILPLILLQSID